MFYRNNDTLIDMSTTAVNGYKVHIAAIDTKPTGSVTTSTISEYYLYYALDDKKLYYKGTYEVLEWTNVSYTKVTSKDQMTANGKYYFLIDSTYYYYWFNGSWYEVAE